MDRFHITLEQYARLTDRQIEELYFHARTEKGEIDTSVPLLPTPEEKTEAEKPDTLESELATLDLVAKLTRMDSAKLDELKGQLRKKYDGNSNG